MRAHQDVVAHGHVAEQRDVLKGAAEPDAGHAVARHVGQRLALELDVAFIVAVNAADAVEQRGFAGTVRTDQATNLAMADIERHTAKGDDTPEAHPHSGNTEQRRCRIHGHHTLCTSVTASLIARRLCIRPLMFVVVSQTAGKWRSARGVSIARFAHRYIAR